MAIKILEACSLSTTSKFIDSFRRESQAAASLSHPNIVNIYDVGREGNIHYIVMELIQEEGRSAITSREQGPMSVSEGDRTVQADRCSTGISLTRITSFTGM